MSYRAGFVAIAGCPNVGKSSFLNRAIGKKVAITARKADTTRYCTQGIVTTPAWQSILVDTPGYTAHPKNVLQKSMQKSLRSALEDADFILWMTDVKLIDDRHAETLSTCLPSSKPVVLLVNKIDLSHEPADLSEKMSDYCQRYGLVACAAISSLGMTPERFQTLFEEWAHYLPVHPPFYEDTALTDRPVRFIAAEFIREKLHRLLGEELPYRVAVTIDSFDERMHSTHIDATIWVAKKAHRPIVLGHQGTHIKRISIAAREDIERLLDRTVMLRIWVKVKERWIDDDQSVSRLYHLLSAM